MQSFCSEMTIGYRVGCMDPPETQLNDGKCLIARHAFRRCHRAFCFATDPMPDYQSFIGQNQ
jgi:hypothetical protein